MESSLKTLLQTIASKGAGYGLNIDPRKIDELLANLVGLTAVEQTFVNDKATQLMQIDEEIEKSESNGTKIFDDGIKKQLL